MKAELAKPEGFLREVKEADLELVGVTVLHEKADVQNVGMLTRLYVVLTGANAKGYHAANSNYLGAAYEDELPELLAKAEAERDKMLELVKKADLSGNIRIIDGRVLP
jgi:hypothetical protein